MKKNIWTIRKERICGLFEGVVAIDLTLLVLELKPPDIQNDGDHEALFSHLTELRPELLAWFISFILIARIWQEQHVIWSFTEHSDSLTIGLMLSLMATVSLVPFGSALVGEYPEAVASVIIFSGIMLSNGLVSAALSWQLARSPHLHGGHGTIPLNSRCSYQLIVFPITAVIAVALAQWQHPLIGISFWLVEPTAAYAFWRMKGHGDIVS